MTHREARRLLYDLLADELSGPERARLEAHLAQCPSCSHERHRLAVLCTTLTRPTEDPASRLTSEDWKAFLCAVDRRIDAHEHPTEAPRRRLPRLPVPFLRPALLVAGGMIIGAAAYVLIRPGGPATESGPPPTRASSTVASETHAELASYVRRSRSLLVGLANIETADEFTDLQHEREKFRELASEARALQNRPLDVRSAALMNDLEKIFIEIANTDDPLTAADLDIVRHGMASRNVLFKLRVTEAAFEAAGGRLNDEKN